MKVVIYIESYCGTQYHFENGIVYHGMGDEQVIMQPTEKCTLAYIKSEGTNFTNSKIGEGLPENTKCEFYESVDGDILIVAEI